MCSSQRFSVVIRICDLWEKGAPRKIFETLFWLGTSSLIPKNSPLFWELLFFFSRITVLLSRTIFVFCGSVFFYSKVLFRLQERPLYFTIILYFFFWNRPLVLEKFLSFYLLCTCFSKNVFICSLLYLHVLLRVAQRTSISLVFVLFPLGTFYWTTYAVFLIISKSLHGVWFFLCFLLKF